MINTKSTKFETKKEIKSWMQEHLARGTYYIFYSDELNSWVYMFSCRPTEIKSTRFCVEY